MHFENPPRKPWSWKNFLSASLDVINFTGYLLGIMKNEIGTYLAPAAYLGARALDWTADSSQLDKIAQIKKDVQEELKLRTNSISRYQTAPEYKIAAEKYGTAKKNRRRYKKEKTTKPSEPLHIEDDPTNFRDRFGLDRVSSCCSSTSSCITTTLRVTSLLCQTSSTICQILSSRTDNIVAPETLQVISISTGTFAIILPHVEKHYRNENQERIILKYSNAHEKIVQYKKNEDSSSNENSNEEKGEQTPLVVNS